VRAIHLFVDVLDDREDRAGFVGAVFGDGKLPPFFVDKCWGSCGLLLPPAGLVCRVLSAKAVCAKNVRTLLRYFVTAIAGIVRCYLPWLWFKKGGSV